MDNRKWIINKQVELEEIVHRKSKIVNQFNNLLANNFLICTIV
jgi:hypothetical protein